MRYFVLSLTLVSVVLTTGCPKSLVKTRPPYNFNHTDALTPRINEYLANAQNAFDCSARGFRYQVNYAAGGKITCLDGLGGPASANPAGADEAKRIRNEMLEDAVGAIDGLYGQFTDDLNNGHSTTNFVADVVDLGTSAAIGITNGERALQVMGIALTAFRGSRKSFELNYFKEQSTPILIAKMDDNRSKQYAIILRNEDKPISNYGIKAAVKDAVDYFNAGTLVRAFSELSKSTAQQADASEKKVLKLRGVDDSQLFTTPEAVVDAINLIGVFKSHYSDKVLNSTDAAIKAKARGELLAVYTEITTGAKKDDFKPVLDEVRKNAALKAVMDKLDAGIPEQPSPAAPIAVTNAEIRDVIFKIYLTARSQKKDDLTVTLKDIFVDKATS